VAPKLLPHCTGQQVAKFYIGKYIYLYVGGQSIERKFKDAAIDTQDPGGLEFRVHLAILLTNFESSSYQRSST